MTSLITALSNAIGDKNVLTGDALTTRYHHIWSMHIPLKAKAVVLPRTTEDVAAIMKICHTHHQPVIVYGGLTNLVGATETKGDEVIIAMERMNVIEEIDEQTRTMTVQAGVILENIHHAAKEKGLLFPLNYGAKGSAQIGGAIATNAGGLQVFRFGMTRNLILGLEVVLADGTILSSLKKIIKDNSAYDLKQLFIGSEGTLGIVTKAVLKLSEAPKSRTSAFIGVASYEKVMQLLRFMDSGLAGTLSGFELLWQSTYIVQTSEAASVKAPLPTDYNFYVLLESLGSNPTRDQALLQELLEQALGEELIEDAVIADNESDLRWFWTVREDVKVLDAQPTYSQHFDISIPIRHIGEVIKNIEHQLLETEGVENVYTFGHVADGNIHLIVGKSNAAAQLTEMINHIIYTPLTALNGSVSAEHGIGLHKKAYLKLCRSESEIALMRTLKMTLDPKNLLNPGKVIDVD